MLGTGKKNKWFDLWFEARIGDSIPESNHFNLGDSIPDSIRNHPKIDDLIRDLIPFKIKWFDVDWNQV